MDWAWLRHVSTPQALLRVAQGWRCGRSELPWATRSNAWGVGDGPPELRRSFFLEWGSAAGARLTLNWIDGEYAWCLATNPEVRQTPDQENS